MASVPEVIQNDLHAAASWLRKNVEIGDWHLEFFFSPVIRRPEKHRQGSGASLPA